MHSLFSTPIQIDKVKIEHNHRKVLDNKALTKQLPFPLSHCDKTANCYAEACSIIHYKQSCLSPCCPKVFVTNQKCETSLWFTVSVSGSDSLFSIHTREHKSDVNEWGPSVGIILERISHTHIDSEFPAKMWWLLVWFTLHLALSILVQCHVLPLFSTKRQHDCLLLLLIKKALKHFL